MLKAVLFDLDFTLLDWENAEPWETYQGRRLGAVRDFVHASLFPLDSVDAAQLFATYIAQLNRAWQESNTTLRAPNIRHILAETLRVSGVPEDRIDIEAVMGAYNWQLAPGERAYPDVMDVLPMLKEHDIALGIVTNASHPMQDRDRELEALGLLDLFPRCRVAAVDVGIIKPHRAIFEHALQLLDARAEEAVFVGDSLHADVHGAQGAGLYGVWRKRALMDHELAVELDGIVPDGTIDTLHDLLPLLDRWYPGWQNGSAS